MFRLIGALLALVMLIAPAQGQMMLRGTGVKAPAAAGYTGPGDIVASADVWWGLRGYSAAVAATGTQKAVQVRRASDNTTADVVILTTGDIDSASALTFAGTDASGAGSITGTTLTFTGGHVGSTVTGGTVAAGTYIVSGSSPTWTVNISQTVVSATLTLTYGLYVAKWYDQSGNGIDQAQGTSANQPQLFFTGGPSSTKPFLLFNVSHPDLFQSAASTSSGTPTMSAVAMQRVTTAKSMQLLDHCLACSNSGPVFYYTSTANQVVLWNGTTMTLSSAVTTGAWHALQAIGNSASSNIYVDGSGNTGNAGGTSGGSQLYTIGSQVNGINDSFLDGSICEIGVWPTVFSAGNATSMNTNQHTYYGF